MVVPSRLEAFGLVALEAQACGVPVVAFAAGGPADIVEDRVTGRLAKAFDPDDLARAIAWVTEDAGRARALGASGRARAQWRSDPKAIAASYAQVYRIAAGEEQ
jgi:glycosyltransferase involved in cell wall biosynthesis